MIRLHRFQSRRHAPFLSLTALFLAVSFSHAQDSGRISGSLIDKDTGEPILAALVSIDELNLTTTSSLDGSYRFQEVPVGQHSLTVEKAGYRTSIITEIEVVAGELQRVDIPMQATLENLIELEAFVVTAADAQRLDIALLADRQKSSAMSDAIGAEDFSRFGSGDAADAMSRVTGVSINEGKYVFVRGLGERYSNTLLNDVALPSSDPDKKAVQMDLFSTDLMESIVTAKSFTPDKPGDFAGGSVNIKTKSFPDLFSLTLSSSFGYNSQANLNSDFLSYDGGQRDWLGFDDGTRAIPDGVPTDPSEFPISNFQPGAAQFFDDITRRFNSVMSIGTDKSFLDTGFSASFGNSYFLGGDQMLGVVASLSYDLSYDHYEDGINARYRRNSLELEMLSPRYVYRDTRSVMNANISSLLSMAYQPSVNHEIALVLSGTFAGSDETRFQQGPTSDSGQNFDAEDQIRSMVFTERSLISAQLRGEHVFDFADIKLDWSLSSASTTQEDPDARYSNNEIIPETGRVSLVKPDRAPRRVYRELTEDQSSLNLNLEIPFLEGDSGLNRNLKIGGVVTERSRDFFEVVYQYQYGSTGNSIFNNFESMDSFLDPEKIGIGDDGPLLKTFINFFRGQDYEGEETIEAYYAMLDFELTGKWRLIGGVRQENTDTTMQSLTPVDERFFSSSAEIAEDKLLPAAQLVYALTDQQNLRLSWSETLARPTFREIAPYRSFPFIGGDEYFGNQNLVQTDIENFDLRWEWFPNPGEIVSISLFRKTLTHPIELVIEEVNANFRERPYNVKKGEIEGVEIEFRKNLSFLHDSLEYFSINANFTFSASEVDNTNREFISKISFFESRETVAAFAALRNSLIEEYGNEPEDWDRQALLDVAPNTPSRRDLFGQPDWITNLSLNYENPIWGTAVSLNFNYVSEKLAYASQGATPDVYDRDRERLDLIISQSFGDNWSLKFSAKNLTNSENERYYDSAEEDIYSSYTSGRSFSLGATYRFH